MALQAWLYNVSKNPMCCLYRPYRDIGKTIERATAKAPNCESCKFDYKKITNKYNIKQVKTWDESLILK